MQFVHGIAIEKVEKVFRRTMVLSEIMYVAFATVLEQSQRGEFGTHKREDSLLLVAKIDDAALIGQGMGIVLGRLLYKGSRREFIDNGELQRVEVLHLVD